jgi:hypothetical protein
MGLLLSAWAIMPADGLGAATIIAVAGGSLMFAWALPPRRAAWIAPLAPICLGVATAAWLPRWLPTTVTDLHSPFLLACASVVIAVVAFSIAQSREAPK